MKPGETDQVFGRWGRNGHELRGGTEEQTEAGGSGAELGGRREREVHLQRALEKKSAVHRPAERNVEVMKCAVLQVHPARPIREDRGQVTSDAQAEHQIDVGPRILAASRGRAGQRRSDNPRIDARRRHEIRANVLAFPARCTPRETQPLLDSE